MRDLPKGDGLSLPKGWVETTLGEAIDIYSGKTRPKQQGAYPVYGGNGILDYGDKFNQEGETIIVGRVGAYCGNVFYETQPFWLSDNALGVKAKEISYEKFLYYKLVSMKLNNHAIGGAQPLLTQTLLKELEINLPPLPEQKAIADMLSSFDEKIELLREQNKTLETLAQTIFKEWFVHFNFPDPHGKPYRNNGGAMVASELGLIPQGWRVGRLGEALEVKRGGSPRPIKDFISDSGYRWLKISDATATSSPFIFEIKEHIKKEGLKKTTLLKKGSLVLSNSATPGVPKFLELDSCIHDGWLHFPSTNIFSYQYLYPTFRA